MQIRGLPKEHERCMAAEGAALRGGNVPIYHPCTKKMRRKKTRSKTTVPTHR